MKRWPLLILLAVLLFSQSDLAQVSTSTGGVSYTEKVPASALPTPSPSTLGGVQSYAPVSHQWINGISTSGAPSSTQPAASDITGLATVATSGSASDLTSGQLSSTVEASQATAQATSGNTERTLAAHAGDTINVTDFGAKCDGTTDDTVAINAAFTAAHASNAYANNRPVVVSGSHQFSQKGCAVTQVNATGFTGWATGAGLVVQDLTLLCSGAGNVCFDTTNSLNVNTQGLTLIGSASSPPLVGYMEGNSSPSNTSCCIHINQRVNIWGSYTFAARLNAGAESVSDYGSIIRNNGATAGTIWALGSVTGGSSYTNGTYTGVALTGGTGTGALATIVVSGNAVTSVTLTYQGLGYAVSDSLSAAAASIGGTGSGFSVPVSSIAQFSYVLDESNHWKIASPFAGQSWTPDTYYSGTQINMFGGSVRYAGSSYAGAPMWAGYAVGMHLHRTYFLQIANQACIDLFDNSATNSAGNNSMIFDMRCESTAATSTFYLYGSKTNPSLNGFQYRDDYAEPTSSIIATAANLASPSMTDARIDVTNTQTASLALFGTPSIWTYSGWISMPTATGMPITPSAFEDIGGIVSFHGNNGGGQFFGQPFGINVGSSGTTNINTSSSSGTTNIGSTGTVNISTGSSSTAPVNIGTGGSTGPVTLGGSGNYTVSAGGFADSNFSICSGSSGGSCTLGSHLNVIPASSTLATYTVTIPTSSVNGKQYCWSTTAAITSLTVSASSGSIQTPAPSSMSAFQKICMEYQSSNTTWYPF